MNDTFAPTGVTCSSGYHGTVEYTVCDSHGAFYTVVGCEAYLCSQFDSIDISPFTLNCVVPDMIPEQGDEDMISDIVDITLQDENGTEVPWTEIGGNISISFLNTTSTNMTQSGDICVTEVSQFSCEWWDTVSLEWTSTGCTPEVNASSVTCDCNHLTSFALFLRTLSTERYGKFCGMTLVTSDYIFSAFLLVTSLFSITQSLRLYWYGDMTNSNRRSAISALIRQHISLSISTLLQLLSITLRPYIGVHFTFLFNTFSHTLICMHFSYYCVLWGSLVLLPLGQIQNSKLSRLMVPLFSLIVCVTFAIPLIMSLMDDFQTQLLIARYGCWTIVAIELFLDGALINFGLMISSDKNLPGEQLKRTRHIYFMTTISGGILFTCEVVIWTWCSFVWDTQYRLLDALFQTTRLLLLATLLGTNLQSVHRATTTKTRKKSHNTKRTVTQRPSPTTYNTVLADKPEQRQVEVELQSINHSNPVALSPTIEVKETRQFLSRVRSSSQ